MPHLSKSTLATGARPLVVHDALEMIVCFDVSKQSWFTLRTVVMSSLRAGAEMTFWAPASTWALALDRRRSCCRT